MRKCKDRIFQTRNSLLYTVRQIILTMRLHGTIILLLQQNYRSLTEEKVEIVNMVSIRKAVQADIEALRALYRELGEDGVRYQPEHFVNGYRDDSFFEEVFSSDNQDILVAEENSRVIGFSHVMIIPQKRAACLKPETVAYIQDLDVLEEMRGKGVGTIMMKASKEYGKTHGADFIRTQVFPQNEDGLRFYERNGFREMMKTIECQFD